MRTRKHPLETIAEWFQVLEVDFIVAAQAAGDDSAKLVQAFDDCKAQAKDNYIRLAFQLHPDRAPEEERPQCEERFKVLSSTWERLKHCEIQPKPPMPPPMAVTTIIVRNVRVRTYTGGTVTGVTDVW